MAAIKRWPPGCLLFVIYHGNKAQCHSRINWTRTAIRFVCRWRRNVMMPAKYSNKGKLISKWSSLYLQAVDFDRWHRVTEAIVEYERYWFDLLTSGILPFFSKLFSRKSVFLCWNVRSFHFQIVFFHQRFGFDT